MTNAQDFAVHRFRETHDIIHVLTGFGIDGVGELGLQGFNLAQNRSPLAAMLIFGGILNSLQKGEALEPLLQDLARGFQMGVNADLVIASKHEDDWERALLEWRQQLRLPVHPDR
ncbi:Coq4 family protein [Synechococcus sp. KORDI-52]|uniref:Coq4 family protein n=1 Tax=Synechococcus sp. KORDI-52 TaxID=585425 RepID=UPI0026907ACD